MRQRAKMDIHRQIPLVLAAGTVEEFDDLHVMASKYRDLKLLLYNFSRTPSHVIVSRRSRAFVTSLCNHNISDHIE